MAVENCSWAGMGSLAWPQTSDRTTETAARATESAALATRGLVSLAAVPAMSLRHR
jgi:hypothetical protein